MNENDSVRSVIEATLNNPKLAPAVTVGTASVGAAAQFGLIDGWLVRASMIIGVATSLVILGVWLIRLEQAWRARSPKGKELE